MKKTKVISTTFAVRIGSLLALSLGLMGPHSFAGDLQWSGTYRIEGYHLNNLELDGRGLDKDYILHHLILRPKIVVGDGITIFSQFDIFNSADYPNSQAGQPLGGGVGAGSPTSSEDSNTLSRHGKSDTLLVSQIYLSWVHEHGALIGGRAPLNFGLGMTYSSGRGLFDHYFDTRDMVAYKFLVGNLAITPMYGKVNEGLLNKNDDVQDYMVQLQYENPETDLEMGIFYQVRKAADSGSDAPVHATESGLFGGLGATATLPVDFNAWSLFALKDTERFRLGLEGSFLSGKTGVLIPSTGDKVSLNGFGLAGEFEYRPEAKKWVAGIKAGVATGDDPDTDNRFEGFVFSRNYNVAMLMFNHPLGRQDVLRTKAFGGGPQDPNASGIREAKLDVESVSNATYLAPYFNYKWSDKWTIKSVLATGWLGADPVAGAAEVGGDLGFETDFSLEYEPRQGVVWTTGLGLLFPGSAFDYNNDGPSFAYGLVSKAAISF